MEGVPERCEKGGCPCLLLFTVIEKILAHLKAKQGDQEAFTPLPPTRAPPWQPELDQGLND